LDHREAVTESEVRFDTERGTGEDESLVLVSNGDVPADVDAAVNLDASNDGNPLKTGAGAVS
jgi:hypothetical protein